MQDDKKFKNHRSRWRNCGENVHADSLYHRQFSKRLHSNSVSDSDTYEESHNNVYNL